MTSSATPDRRLVLVTGSTRSGTSMAAGTLHHLGLHVPQPVLRANESNPAGFFESTWPVEFHKRLFERCLVSHTDARPEAFDLVAATVNPTDRAELRGWLGSVFDAARQAVVKDPRATWATRLWAETAESLGAGGGVVIMVRHPAEVVASRTTYYHGERQGGDPWQYQVRNLCTWINVNTGVERRTRDDRRVVVRYHDLATDWRSAATRMSDAFGIDLDVEHGGRAVDAFIDPRLRRHQPSWAGMGLPEPLVELAEEVWQALGDLAGGRDEPAVAARLDALGAAYVRHMAVANAMDHDASTARVRMDRRARDGGTAGGSPAADPRAATRIQGPGRMRRLTRRWIPRRIRELARRGWT